MKAVKNRIEVIGGECPTNGAQSGVEVQHPYRVLVELKGITLNDNPLVSIDDTLAPGVLRIGKQRFYTIK